MKNIRSRAHVKSMTWMLAYAAQSASAAGFLGDIGGQLASQVEKTQATTAALSAERVNGRRIELPALERAFLPGPNARVGQPETTSAARPSNIAPVSLSKDVSRLSDKERVDLAQAISVEIENLRAQLNERLTINPKDEKVMAEIAAINNALSAKLQAYNFTLGKMDEVSNAAAESFAALNSPYFLICGNSLWARNDPLEWAKKLEPVKQKILQAGRSVGLLSVNKRPAGTGFVYGNGMVVTNSHVIRAMADYLPAKKLWMLKPAVEITFDVEYTLGAEANCAQANTARTYAVTGVLFVSSDAATAIPNEKLNDDIAVILTTTDETYPKKLDIVAKPAEKYAGKMVIAVLGYPGPPTDMTIAEQMEFFSTPSTITPEFPYKRVSQGFASDQNVDSGGMFSHRANTSGGNSGSPILDLDSGDVVGVHVRGENRFHNVLGRNFGITSERVRAVFQKSGLN